MSKSILFVDDEVVWRGGQEQLFSLMSGLDQSRFRVFLSAPENAPLSDRAANSGIPVFPLGPSWEVSLFAILRFFNLLQSGGFDLVHFNTPKSFLAGGIACRLARVPGVVISRRVNFPLRSILSSLKYNLLADRIFTVSASIRETLIRNRVAPGRVSVIYEGVDLDWFDRQMTRSVVQGRGRTLLGTVAHLSSEKGHETLLEAFAQLKDRCPETLLLIVGDGELRSALETKVIDLGIADQVRFLGFRTDVEGLVKQLDVFCLPSLSEGLSSAILAAMAARLPVVATSVGGIPELVQDGVTGRLVTPNNPHQLAVALENLLKDEALRERMGKSGRQRVESHFTLQGKLEATERAYDKLLSMNER
jgi:glycosyltransferase involved in cell wall biosynthesis